MKTKNWIGVLAALAFPAAALAQEAGPVVTPGERGHLRKMTAELVGLAKAKDHGARMDHYLRMAGERVREMERMHQRGRASHHDALGRSYEKCLMRGATGAVENGAACGRDMTGALGRYAEATAKHLAVLEGVLQKVPPQARQGILRALEASRHGHEQAVQAHARVRERVRARNGQGGGGPDCPGQGGGPGGVGRPGGGEGKGRGQGMQAGKGKPEEQEEEGGRGQGQGQGPMGPPPGKGKGGGQQGPPPGKGGGGGGRGNR